MGIRLAALVVAAAASLTFASAAAAADDALLAPAGVCAAGDQLDLDAASAQQSMLCLTNWARAQSGLPALALNSALNEAGQAKLVANVSCAAFTHTPCGNVFSAVFGAYLAGARGYQIGENLAWGTGSYGTPRQTMNGWLHSEAHRANLLTAAYRDIGIGYLPNQHFEGRDGATLWSQEFGTRSEPAVQPAAAKKPPARKRSRRR